VWVDVSLKCCLIPLLVAAQIFMYARKYGFSLVGIDISPIFCRLMVDRLQQIENKPKDDV
jgi:hypothetical protein